MDVVILDLYFRWKVTSKEAMSQISEYSEAGITVRGQYYGPGKTPPEGERKLFLAIESTSELAVQKAGFSTILNTLILSYTREARRGDIRLFIKLVPKV